MNIKALLTKRIEKALHDIAGAKFPAEIQRNNKIEDVDYQANGIMRAAKQINVQPRELAREIILQSDCDDIAESLEIGGPGFINIKLRDSFLTGLLEHKTLVRMVKTKQTVIVDYSSPNLAKEMHVGHLRSTIIGDAIARMLECLGHKVIRQNYVGDWGTQFGMLLANMQEEQFTTASLSDLEDFYRSSKKKFDADSAFADRARSQVVALQSGDQSAITQWRKYIEISLTHCQTVYEQLGVSLTNEDIAGESSYNDSLPLVIEILEQKDLLEESEGAQCVFLEEFSDTDGHRRPLIVRKKDGGYLYATTDLAAILHRKKLGAERIIYITDARQKMHFNQVFAVAKKAGFSKGIEKLEHFATGAMFGSDGKPFKTRDGGVIRLTELLDEAQTRAKKLIQSKNPDLSESEQLSRAREIGIGAVKYADLSKNRNSDYLFDWDNMLTLNGNTAPYLQYAYARIQSIFRQAKVTPDNLTGNIILDSDSERRLAKELIRFQEILDDAATEGYPHYLCNYLFSLSSQFSRFYEDSPILGQSISTRRSRLLLCERTAKTLRLGLSLLGINVLDRM